MSNPTRQQFNLDTPLLSIDTETTGLDEREDQVLEIGAVIDFDGKGALEEMPAYRCLVRHRQYRGQPYAIQMNAGIFRILAGVDKDDVAILTPDEALLGLESFICKNMPAGVKKMTPAGKNFSGFDRQFLANLSPLFGQAIAPRLAYRTFDAGNLFWNPVTDGFNLPGLEECLARAGMEPTGLHTAVGDAIDVVRLVRYKMAQDRAAA